jgi:hypothetical protein
MKTEHEAFFRRLNVHPRGQAGLNERFGRDPFLMSVCGHLKPLFAHLSKGLDGPPAPPKRFSMHNQIKQDP